MRPLLTANSFNDHIQAQLSPTSKMATMYLKGRKNTRVRIDQLVYGACQLPPFTNAFAAARLLVFEGAPPPTFPTGTDTFTTNWDNFNPPQVFLDIVLAQPFVDLPFPKGLYGTPDKDVGIMLLAAYNIADTINTPSTMQTTLNVLGDFESTLQNQKGKITVLG